MQRGERLALMRVRFAAPDGFEQVMLTLYEANAEGLQARLVTFDQVYEAYIEELTTRHKFIGPQSRLNGRTWRKSGKPMRMPMAFP